MTKQEIQQYVYDFLYEKGLPHITICAIMGNITGENANWNISAIEAGSGIGLGLCQWSFGRRTLLENYGTTLKHQCEFLWAELRTPGSLQVILGVDGQWIGTPSSVVTNIGYKNFSMTIDTFKSGNATIEDLTRAFCYCWERPAPLTNHLTETRIPAAKEFYKKMAYAKMVFPAIPGETIKNNIHSGNWPGYDVQLTEHFKLSDFVDESTLYKYYKFSEDTLRKLELMFKRYAAIGSVLMTSTYRHSGLDMHNVGGAVDIQWFDTEGKILDCRYIACAAAEIGFTGIAPLEKATTDGFVFNIIHLDTRADYVKAGGKYSNTKWFGYEYDLNSDGWYESDSINADDFYQFYNNRYPYLNLSEETVNSYLQQRFDIIDEVSYRNPVVSVILKSADEKISEDSEFIVETTLTENWEQFWEKAGYTCGYRVSLISNGRILGFKDNYTKSEIKEFKFKPKNFISGKKLKHEDNLQIGIGTWMHKNLVQTFSDGSDDGRFPVCSNSICLKDISEMPDMLFIKRSAFGDYLPVPSPSPDKSEPAEVTYESEARLDDKDTSVLYSKYWISKWNNRGGLNYNYAMADWPGGEGLVGAPQNYKEILSTTGTTLPNCTSWAWGRAYELMGVPPITFSGDAGNWWDSNKNAANGYDYGIEPRFGAIACWQNPKTHPNGGHVAIVEKVNSDGTVYISESGYKTWGWLPFNVQKLNPSTRSNYKFLGYIYLPIGETSTKLDSADYYKPNWGATDEYVRVQLYVDGKPVKVFKVDKTEK